MYFRLKAIYFAFRESRSNPLRLPSFIGQELGQITSMKASFLWKCALMVQRYFFFTFIREMRCIVIGHCVLCYFVYSIPLEARLFKESTEVCHLQLLLNIRLQSVVFFGVGSK